MQTIDTGLAVQAWLAERQNNTNPVFKSMSTQADTEAEDAKVKRLAAYRAEAVDAQKEIDRVRTAGGDVDSDFIDLMRKFQASALAGVTG